MVDGMIYSGEGKKRLVRLTWQASVTRLQVLLILAEEVMQKKYELCLLLLHYKQPARTTYSLPQDLEIIP